MKEYFDFVVFYNEALKLVEQINSETIAFYADDKVKVARKNISKEMLNCYIKIGVMSDKVVNSLKTSNSSVKFSMDNLIKNIFKHNDIDFNSYLKIPLILKHPSKVIKLNNDYDIMLLKNDEKFYQLVVKTTKNREENFVKSFHLIQQKRYDKY